MCWAGPLLGPPLPAHPTGCLPAPVQHVRQEAQCAALQGGPHRILRRPARWPCGPRPGDGPSLAIYLLYIITINISCIFIDRNLNIYW